MLPAAMKRGGVGDDDVTVSAIEDGGMIAGYFVVVLASRKRFGRPFGVIPAAALNPLAGLGGGDIFGDAILHIGERGGVVEVDREFLLAGFGHVGVGVIEAGHDEGSGEIDDLGVRAAEFHDHIV